MNTSGDNLNFTRFLATHRPTAQALLKGSDAFPHLRGRVLLYGSLERNNPPVQLGVKKRNFSMRKRKTSCDKMMMVWQPHQNTGGFCHAR